jgi:hypothetical protein
VNTVEAVAAAPVFQGVETMACKFCKGKKCIGECKKDKKAKKKRKK